MFPKVRKAATDKHKREASSAFHRRQVGPLHLCEACDLIVKVLRVLSLHRQDSDAACCYCWVPRVSSCPFGTAPCSIPSSATMEAEAVMSETFFRLPVEADATKTFSQMQGVSLVPSTRCRLRSSNRTDSLTIYLTSTGYCARSGPVITSTTSAPGKRKRTRTLKRTSLLTLWRTTIPCSLVRTRSAWGGSVTGPSRYAIRTGSSKRPGCPSG